MKLFKSFLTLFVFVIFLILNHGHAHDGDSQNSDGSGASEEDSNDVQSDKRGITGSKKWDKVSQNRWNAGRRYSFWRKQDLP